MQSQAQQISSYTTDACVSALCSLPAHCSMHAKCLSSFSLPSFIRLPHGFVNHHDLYAIPTVHTVQDLLLDTYLRTRTQQRIRVESPRQLTWGSPAAQRSSVRDSLLGRQERRARDLNVELLLYSKVVTNSP